MLEVADLHIVYPDHTPAVAGISFRLAPGEKAALLGANGAGKSTLLLALAGVLPPAGGAIVLDGAAYGKKNLPQLRQQAGLVFQDPDDQLFMPTIGEDAAFGLRNQGLAPELVERRVEKVLTELGIRALANRPSQRLSGGERRVAALATILVMEPRLLLLDEPTAFLDPRARRRLISLLQQRPEAQLIATHDPELARTLAGRVLLLKQGKLLADGPAEQILADAALLDEAGL